MARKLRYNDEEGGMVKAQLQKIEMYAAKLNEMIHPDDEIEAWVQSKLSVVAAYMGDVKHYLDYELKQQFGDGGSMPSKPRHWEVEFTWEEADDESRKVNVVADSVADAEEQVKMKFAPYYKGFRVVEVEEDKEITWEEYAKRPKKYEIESDTDYETLEAEDEDDAREKWMARRKGDTIKSEIKSVKRKFANGGTVSYDIEWIDEEGDTYSASFDTLQEAKEEIKKIREEGGRVTETWKYVDGEFTGRFSSGGKVTKKEALKKLKEFNAEYEKSKEGTFDDFDVDSLDAYEKMKYDSLRKRGLSKTKALFVIINDVEDDYSQLSSELHSAYMKYLTGEDFGDGGEVRDWEEKLEKLQEDVKHYQDKMDAWQEDEKQGLYNQILENKLDSARFALEEHLKKGKAKGYADGGVMRYESSTLAEDMEEAKDYLGEERWDTLSREDKVNATQYLKAKGLIGYFGQEEEVADFMASQYRSGGSIYRGIRPSPSVSATAYPEGYKMIGNDGNMWKIALNSKGIHRWVKVSGASYDDRMEQRVKIRQAIELLEDMRDTVDVEDEIESLKKQLR